MTEGEPDHVVAAPDRVGLLDRLLEPVDRHDDVLGERQAASGHDREREPSAPAPERLDALAVGGSVDGDSALAEDLDQLGLHLRRLGGGPVRLGDDHEAGVVGHAAVERAARAGQRLAVEELDRRRPDAAPDHPQDRRAARRHVAVEHGDRQHDLRRRDQPQPRRGDDPERALGADQQALHVVARDILADRPADRDHLARRDDRLEPGHPRAGGAVLVRVRPGGVGRDVAADLRLLGCARVGSEHQPVVARERLDVPGLDACLDVHPPEQRVEPAHAGEPVECEDDPAVERHAPAGRSGAAAARRDRHVVLVAPGDDGRDLVGARRQHDCLGVAREARDVRRVVARLGQDGLVAHDRAQLSLHGVESRA